MRPKAEIDSLHHGFLTSPHFMVECYENKAY